MFCITVTTAINKAPTYRNKRVMAEEELELDVNQPKSSKMMMILVVVLIVLVLAVGGVGAWLFLGKDDSASSHSVEKTEPELGPLKYLTMVPEFIVNFGPGSKVRYLQVDLQISSRDEAALATVGTYRPVIRNDILVVLSGVSFAELNNRSGKEALQQKLLNAINKVVVSTSHAAPHDKKKDGKDNSHDEHSSSSEDENVEGPIENVYFTSFIMQ